MRLEGQPRKSQERWAGPTGPPGWGGGAGMGKAGGGPPHLSLVPSPAHILSEQEYSRTWGFLFSSPKVNGVPRGCWKKAEAPPTPFRAVVTSSLASE